MDNNKAIESKSNYKKTVNFLHYNLGFTIHDSNSIIRRYGKKKDITYPKDNNVYGYVNLRAEAFNNIGDVIQENWQEFMTFYGSIKKNYKKTQLPQKQEAIISS